MLAEDTGSLRALQGKNRHWLEIRDLAPIADVSANVIKVIVFSAGIEHEL